MNWPAVIDALILYEDVQDPVNKLSGKSDGDKGYICQITPFWPLKGFIGR